MTTSEPQTKGTMKNKLKMEAEPDNTTPLPIGATVFMSELQEILGQQSNDLSSTLKERFLFDLIATMTMTMFHTWSKSNSDSKLATDGMSEQAVKFWEFWINGLKNKTAPEIERIAATQMTDKSVYLQAMSGYTLPAIEDYQNTYNRAMADVKLIFDKNMKSNTENDGEGGDF